MRYEKLSIDDQVSNLIKFIIKVLQEAGGQLDRSEIRSRISELNDDIGEFEQKIYTSKNGTLYKKFDFRFNTAMKELQYVKFIDYIKYKPETKLTKLGEKVDLSTFDPKTEVRDKAAIYWEEFAKQRKENSDKKGGNKTELLEKIYEQNSKDEDQHAQLRLDLSNAIAKMSPAKFEKFWRKLLEKMGIDFDDKEGIQISRDGGIDGFGYHIDGFKTTRVVIQCKRFNTNSVGSTDIDRFRGAMDKFGANHAVFITNSRFTEDAKNAARAGSKPITLIDGNKLIDLIIKYELELIPVKIYKMDEKFYLED